LDFQASKWEVKAWLISIASTTGDEEMFSKINFVPTPPNKDRKLLLPRESMYILRVDAEMMLIINLIQSGAGSVGMDDRMRGLVVSKQWWHLGT